jgi:hypothetical protein
LSQKKQIQSAKKAFKNYFRMNQRGVNVLDIQESTAPDSLKTMLALNQALQNFSVDSSVIEHHLGLRYYYTTLISADNLGNKVALGYAENTVIGTGLVRALDGEPLWDYFLKSSPQKMDLASLNLKDSLLKLQSSLIELKNAPVLEDYRGPVLFDKSAAGTFLEQVLLKPLSQMKNTENQRSELFKVYKKRIFPHFISVIDTPNLAKFLGQELFGFYTYDQEGNKAQTVQLIDRGILSDFYEGQEAISDKPTGNGHFKYGQPWFGVVKMSSEKPFSPKDQIQKLLELATSENNNFALVVDRFEIPEAFELLKHPLTVAISEKSSGSEAGALYFPVPVALYRIDVNAQVKTRVRSSRFNPIDLKTLRSISSLGSQYFVVEPKSTGTILTPSILLELLDLTQMKQKWPE